ncbi:hypothetical protein [Profundibacter sp.]
MSEPTLTATRLFEGVWEGVLTGYSEMPEIVATHLDTPLEDVSVTQDGETARWLVQVPVPASALSDGLQTIVISDKRTGATLNSFTILAGSDLDNDIRSEVALLRAELDMLKKAFRRHCVETM